MAELILTKRCISNPCSKPKSMISLSKFALSVDRINTPENIDGGFLSNYFYELGVLKQFP